MSKRGEEDRGKEKERMGDTNSCAASFAERLLKRLLVRPVIVFRLRENVSSRGT